MEKKTQAQKKPGNRSRQTIFWAGVLGAVVVSLFFVSLALDVFLIVFASILMAILLRIPVNWIAPRTPLSEKLSFFVSIFLILTLLALLGWLLAPSIGTQLEQIMLQVPDALDQLDHEIQQYPWAQNIFEQPLETPAMIPPVGEMGSILEQVSGVFSGALGSLTNILIFLILGFYFAYEPELYVNGLVKLFPQQSRKRVRHVITDIIAALKWWLVGRLFAMVVLGVLVGVGLALLQIPLALGLGILAGLFSFVPIIGAILAVIPAGLVALAQGPLPLLYVVLLYLGAQGVESYFITPIVQKRTALMAPALALVIQLLMVILIGPVGVAIAYPLAVVGQVLLKRLYLEGVLGEQIEIVPT